jgi:hypothetical protein
MEFENEQSQSQETPEVLDKELAPSAETPEAAPELVDLDTMDKFKFGGREWTPKELEAAYMRQQDYSRKTQEIAQERKYYDNLPYDLDMVKNNPALVNQFKQVYPAKFHSWIDSCRTGKTGSTSATRSICSNASTSKGVPRTSCRSGCF